MKQVSSIFLLSGVQFHFEKGWGCTVVNVRRQRRIAKVLTQQKRNFNAVTTSIKRNQGTEVRRTLTHAHTHTRTQVN